MRVKTLHFGISNISRNKAIPDNAVAACAYRCGEDLHDAAGKKYRYGNRRGVLAACIFAPVGAADWLQDADQKRAWQRFGQEIEQAENGHNKRATALLAKDFQVAAPRALSHTQNWQLAQDFAARFTAKGLAVAVAFHEQDASDGKKNPHFHFLVPMRTVTKRGFDNKRYRTLDAMGKGRENPELLALRREYFALVNDALEDAGVTGIVYDPEKQEGKEPGIHKGKAACALERKGQETDKGNAARRAQLANKMRPVFEGMNRGAEIIFRFEAGSDAWEKMHNGMNGLHEQEFAAEFDAPVMREAETPLPAAAAPLAPPAPSPVPLRWQEYITEQRTGQRDGVEVLPPLDRER